jgi:cobalamin-dependent methionine synthase I
MQEDLAEKMSKEGFKITNRYSPGDCGWPVTDQQKLFTLFPENFCGISLSESSLMHPIKSVSGIIGIGQHVRKTAYACDLCEMDTCVYRYRKEVRSTP